MSERHAASSQEPSPARQSTRRARAPGAQIVRADQKTGGGRATSSAGHRGRPSHDDYVKTVSKVIRWNAFQLEDCATLAQLPGVQTLARQLQRSVFPSGVAIRTLIDRSVSEIEAIALRQRDVTSLRLLAFLEIWYREGGTVTEVATALQLSRSHVAHTIQTHALELVARRFLEHAWRIEVSALGSARHR